MARGDTKATRNHDVIRGWADARGGKPATVRDTGDGQAGILRIDFPGYTGEDTLEEISWDDFFEKFDEKELVFLYQDETEGGETSRFFKFVRGDTAEQAADAWT